MLQKQANVLCKLSQIIVCFTELKQIGNAYSSVVFYHESLYQTLL